MRRYGPEHQVGRDEQGHHGAAQVQGYVGSPHPHLHLGHPPRHHPELYLPVRVYGDPGLHRRQRDVDVAAHQAQQEHRSIGLRRHTESLD